MSEARDHPEVVDAAKRVAIEAVSVDIPEPLRSEMIASLTALLAVNVIRERDRYGQVATDAKRC